jgi:hypothetical protein
MLSTSFSLSRKPSHDEPTATSNRAFLAAVLGQPKRLHYSRQDTLYTVQDGYCLTSRINADFPVNTTSLGIQAIHQCFAAHVSFSFRPEVAWYMIIHEVAEYVRQNSTECAHLFTDTPDAKQEIRVRDDTLRYDVPSDWTHAISLFRKPLAAKLSAGTSELFLPRFSTSGPVEDITLLLTLMDAASPYYDYVVETRCGIPQIRLEGDAADWQLLRSQAAKLAEAFPGLSGYFTALSQVLDKIVESVTRNADVEWWQSLYKFKEHSGSEEVTGWINAFFAYVNTPKGQQLKPQFGANARVKPNNFPSHISQIPFVWEYLGKPIDMLFAAGITGIDFDGWFLEPRLGFAVAEVGNASNEGDQTVELLIPR